MLIIINITNRKSALVLLFVHLCTLVSQDEDVSTDHGCWSSELRFL